MRRRHPDRIVVEPALPDVGDEPAGLEVERARSALPGRVGVGRVGGGVAVDLQRRPRACRRRTGPSREAARRRPRRRSRSRRGASGRRRAMPGGIETSKSASPAWEASAAEDVGAHHRHDHRAVAARRLAGDPAVVAVGGGRVALVDERDDLVAEVGLVAAGRRSSRGTASRRSCVQQSTMTTIASGHSSEASSSSTRSIKVGSKNVPVRPHVELAGVALDHVDRRQRARMVELDARAGAARAAGAAPGRRAGCRRAGRTRPRAGRGVPASGRLHGAPRYLLVGVGALVDQPHRPSLASTALACGRWRARPP